MSEARKQFVESYISDLQVRILNAGFCRCKPNWGCNDLRPEYNKIYYICGGEGWIKIEEDVFYPKPGQFVFIPAGTLHSFSAVNDNTFTKYWCHFTSNVALAPLFTYFLIPYCIDLECNPETELPFKKLGTCWRKKPPYYILKSKAAVLDIVSAFFERCLSGSSADTLPLSLHKLLDLINYIDDHLSETIKVEDLAERMHYHPNYFIKNFKAHLGLSPMQYINKRRLETAKQLILNSGMPFGEIASKTGFSDIYHFSKSFKKYTGVTPKDFRNSNDG